MVLGHSGYPSSKDLKVVSTRLAILTRYLMTFNKRVI